MKVFAIAAMCIALAGCATAPPLQLVQGEEARQQVAATERAFESFLSEDTVFFSGPKPLHGKQAVMGFWGRFFKDPAAPFSWEPALVEVLQTGALARSTGPVRDPEGKLFACFDSIWRQEARGQWKIVFDHGMGPQECEKK